MSKRQSRTKQPDAVMGDKFAGPITGENIPGEVISEEKPEEVTPKLAFYKLAHLLELVATGGLTMTDAQKQLGTWWNGLPEAKKKELALELNTKAEQMRMIAEALAQEFYVLSLNYR